MTTVSSSIDTRRNEIQLLHASANTLTIRYPPLPRPSLPDPSSVSNALRMAVMENNPSNIPLYSLKHANPNENHVSSCTTFSSSEDSVRNEIPIYRIEYYVMGFASFLSRWQSAQGYGSFSRTAYEDIFGATVTNTSKTVHEIFGGRQLTDPPPSSKNIYTMIELFRLPKYYNTIIPYKSITMDDQLRNVLKLENITLSSVYTLTPLASNTRYGLRVTPGILTLPWNDNNKDTMEGKCNDTPYNITWYEPYPTVTNFTTLSMTEEAKRLALIEEKKKKLLVSHDQYLQRSQYYHQLRQVSSYSSSSLYTNYGANNAYEMDTEERGNESRSANVSGSNNSLDMTVELD